MHIQYEKERRDWRRERLCIAVTRRTVALIMPPHRERDPPMRRLAALAIIPASIRRAFRGDGSDCRRRRPLLDLRCARSRLLLAIPLTRDTAPPTPKTPRRVDVVSRTSLPTPYGGFSVARGPTHTVQR